MHENEIIVCPQPIFFDARDLVYQMKEPRSKSIQKQSLNYWNMKKWQFRNLVILYEKPIITNFWFCKSMGLG